MPKNSFQKIFQIFHPHLFFKVDLFTHSIKIRVFLIFDFIEYLACAKHFRIRHPRENFFRKQFLPLKYAFLLNELYQVGTMSKYL